jgi:hypothetical protein
VRQVTRVGKEGGDIEEEAEARGHIDTQEGRNMALAVAGADIAVDSDNILVA